MKSKKISLKKCIQNGIKFISAGLLFAIQVLTVGAETKTATAYIPVQVEGSRDVAVEIRSDNSRAMSCVSEPIIKVNDEGQATFEVTEKDPAQYTYTITQHAGNNKKAKYDDVTYKCETIFVYDENDQLESYTLLWKDGKETKSDAVRFENKVESDESANSGVTGSSIALSVVEVAAGIGLMIYAYKHRKARLDK